MTLGNLSEPVIRWLDVISIAAVLGWIVSALPAVATVVTVLWMGVRLATSLVEYRIARRKLKDMRDDEG